MNYQLTHLKGLISVYATEFRVRDGVLRKERGINDFFIDASEKGWDAPKEIACRLLSTCCVDRILYDQVLCLIAIAYLDRTIGAGQLTEAEVHRRAKDCLEAAINPGTYESCLAWANTWWP